MYLMHSKVCLVTLSKRNYCIFRNIPVMIFSFLLIGINAQSITWIPIPNIYIDLTRDTGWLIFRCDWRFSTLLVFNHVLNPLKGNKLMKKCKINRLLYLLWQEIGVSSCPYFHSSPVSSYPISVTWQVIKSYPSNTLPVDFGFPTVPSTNVQTDKTKTYVF